MTSIINTSGSRNLCAIIRAVTIVSCFITLGVTDSVVTPGPAVIVEAPPAAVWSKKIYMVRKQDLELRCTVALSRRTTTPSHSKDINRDLTKRFTNANPTVVSWLKNDSPIASVLTENDDFLIIAHRLLLKPHKDAERLEGDYSCNATWSNIGSLVSPAITVHLAGFKKLRQDQKTTKIIYALPNNTAFIPCVVPESKPRAVRVWFSKDNVSELIESGLTGGNYVSETGMQIAPTENMFEAQGLYTCMVQNPMNLQTKESKSIQLLVDNSTKTFSTIKVVTPEQKSTKLDVNSGENVTLECVMTGIPTPSISWEKYGGSLPIGRFKQNLGNLHLFNVSKADDGTYLCRAGESKDTTTKYHQHWPLIVFTLIVNEPVKATLSVAKSIEYEGAWQLFCDTSGGRAILPSWYYNGQPLPNKGFKPLEHRFDGGENPKSSLTLKGPLMDGFYQCFARSPNGDFSDSDNFLVTSSTDFDDSDQMTTSGMEDNEIFLTTIDTKLPQIVEGPENTTTFENVAVTLVCRVARENSVVWLKDGSELNWGGRYSLIGSGSLEILNVSMKDKGFYTCLALNSQGNATASAFLNIEHPMISVIQHDIISDHYVDQDEIEYGDDDKLLITDASNEVTVVTTPMSTNLNKKNKKLKIQLDAPTIYRMSNTSVLLKWELPSDDDLPGSPQLFKVQFKKIKTGSKWETVDIDLPDYSRSHSIDGLEPGAKYKFRVAVVFDNDLQSVSKTSSKFILSPEPEISAPTTAPVLQRCMPISPSAIEVFWEHPISETATLEGFIINYRRLYAGAPSTLASYQNETVMGGNTREHVLTHLLPATPYEIKISAFNSAGKSRISQPMVLSTFTSDGTLSPLTFLPSLITTEINSKNASVSKINPSSNGQTSTIFGLNQETFLLIVGVILGCILIFTIVAMIFCALKQRKKEKVVIATSKGKFRDASKRIYREQSLLKDKVSNNLYSPSSNKNLLKNNNLPPPPSVTGYATNGHIVNLYSNPLDTALDEGQLDFNEASDELNGSLIESGLANKNNLYKNYLDVSMSGRSNSTASQHSDRSKSNGTSNGSKPTVPIGTSPLLIDSSISAAARTGSASTAVDSQYLWTRGSSPRPGDRRSWNISSSPHSSVVDAVDSRQYNLEPQEANKQFYTFKPERSPHHLGGGGSHQQTRRFGDPKKIRLSDGYHSDA